MAQVGNNVDRLGGPYMIQDRDHMTEADQQRQDAANGARQSDQSQSSGRQQGDNNTGARQGERRQAQ